MKQKNLKEKIAFSVLKFVSAFHLALIVSLFFYYDNIDIIRVSIIFSNINGVVLFYYWICIDRWFFTTTNKLENQNTLSLHLWGNTTWLINPFLSFKKNRDQLSFFENQYLNNVHESEKIKTIYLYTKDSYSIFLITVLLQLIFASNGISYLLNRLSKIHDSLFFIELLLYYLISCTNYIFLAQFLYFIYNKFNKGRK